MSDKKEVRMRRAKRTRAKIEQLGVMRLSVHRTPRHIYAQVIAPDGGHVVASASTLVADLRKDLKATGNVEAAKAVGKAIAERAIAKGIKEVSFDRGGAQYHGRVQVLADAAREAGLSF